MVARRGCEGPWPGGGLDDTGGAAAKEGGEWTEAAPEEERGGRGGGIGVALTSRPFLLTPRPAAVPLPYTTADSPPPSELDSRGRDAGAGSGGRAERVTDWSEATQAG